MTSSTTKHRSGFINIVGNPNVGKSTLMNALVGERMSIITNKPQTTRHRIIGLLSGEDFQIVFSDTPGLVKKPSYKMHQAMNSFVHTAFDDADILLLVIDVNEKILAESEIIKLLPNSKAPVILVLNKIDTISEAQLIEMVDYWKKEFPFKSIHPISALHKFQTDVLLHQLKELLPEGPEYYPKDQLTDRPERFFVSEIIREKILEQYREEIPYSCEVIVTDFKEDSAKQLTRIYATIFVARDTQKSIIIGKNGTAIKNLGIAARKDIEIFINQQCYLELFVKVKDNWRDDDNLLKQFGYQA